MSGDNVSQTYLPLDIAHGIRCAAKNTPTKIALREGSRSLLYRELVDRMNRVSSGVIDSLGLVKGDHVALIAPNCIEFPEIALGLAQSGVAAVMVNPKLTADEIKYICDDSEAKVIFAHETVLGQISMDELPHAERIIVIGGDYDEWLSGCKPEYELQPLSETDTFALCYTAGTTGKPKGVMLSHRSRVITFFGMAAEYGCYTPGDRTLAIAPLFHGGGFAFAMAGLFFGGYCEILAKFDPEATLEKLQASQITNVFMVPTHFQAIFSLPADKLAALKPTALKTIISNAAPLPQALKEKVMDYFGDGILHETYGSTEGGIVSNIRPIDQRRKDRCVGLGFPCTQIRLINEEGQEVKQGEVGELYSRSPYLFSGYWKLPEATQQSVIDGWFSAGDMAQQDEEGYLYLVDRKKDLIISGGVNVYPREIEELLHRHPAVADVAVIGITDDYWGEAIKAYVVIGAGQQTNSADLQEFCQKSLAKYKVPKSFEFIDMLPRNAAGKILKRALRDLN